MPIESSRKALHAYVTDTAHEQWHGFAADQGISVSAILEALAPALQTSELGGSSASLDISTIVIQSRQIDAKRRRRRS